MGTNICKNVPDMQFKPFKYKNSPENITYSYAQGV